VPFRSPKANLDAEPPVRSTPINTIEQTYFAVVSEAWIPGL
jgi:hypothetical protein